MSVSSIVAEVDQYKSKPDRKILCPMDSTCSSESKDDGFSFISHPECFFEIEYVGEWRAHNDVQDLKSLRKSNHVVLNTAKYLSNRCTDLTRAVVDLKRKTTRPSVLG